MFNEYFIFQLNGKSHQEGVDKVLDSLGPYACDCHLDQGKTCKQNATMTQNWKYLSIYLSRLLLCVHIQVICVVVFTCLSVEVRKVCFNIAILIHFIGNSSL